MTDALKPCPFCGGPVYIEEASPTRDGMFGERRWWGVICRNTENVGRSCAIQQRPSASKEAAISRWNLRAALAAPPGWKLVPVEPTDAMEAAFDDAHHRAYFHRAAYRAMLAAAPDAPTDQSHPQR